MRKFSPNPTLLLRLAAVSVFFTALSFAQQTHTVSIKQLRFQTQQLQIKPGDTVEWKNDDIYSHSVVADNGNFDSGLIDPGNSWKHTFNDAGTFGYHCRPHPNMTASVIVGSGSPQSAPKQGSSPPNDSAKFEPPTSPQQFHPILVNFTAALLPLSLLSDLLGRFFRRQSLHNAAWWLVLYATLITPLTVAAGWWWKHAAGPTLPLHVIAVHQWLGTGLAFAFIILATWRWQLHKRDIIPGLPYLALAFITVLALVYQGSLGGTMAFGRQLVTSRSSVLHHL